MAKPCPVARAIPLDLLGKGLGQHCFGPANIGTLQQDTELPNLRFRPQQIFSIVDWARNEAKSRGRHSAVSAELDANILAWITGKAERNVAAIRTDIKNYCWEVCKIELTRGWVDSFISRHSAELIKKQSSPQEEPRLQVPRVVPRLHSTQHARGGTGSSSRSGIQSGRSRDIRLGRPTTEEGGGSENRPAPPHSIHHPLSPSVKRISVVACISASGTCLTPYVVMSQGSAAVRRDLEVDGMQIGRHLIVKHRGKPYVSAELFEDYLRSVFLPHLMITAIVKDR
jgi:hypothetical protein